MENKLPTDSIKINPAILASLTAADVRDSVVNDMLAPEFGEKGIRYSATSGEGWKGNLHSWGFNSVQ